MKNILFLILPFLSLLYSCKKQEVAEGQEEKQANVIKVSDIQYKSAGIQMGTVTAHSMNTLVQATGKLDVPPQNMVNVSAPMGGFIKSTSLLQGTKIKKGQVLAELQHTDYIQLQQDYLMEASQLELAEAEYKRQQELAVDNVNARKTIQQAKAQYEGKRAMVQGLRAKLGMMNIQPEQIISQGIQPSIKLYSPIDGYVTEVNVNIGKFVNPMDVIFTLVNTEHLHVELKVFEKDIVYVKAGQEVSFHLLNEATERKATVYLVGKDIGEERTVRVHCHLKTEDKELLPGMFVSATVNTGKTETPVLPDEAIVFHMGKPHVFVPGEEKNSFQMVPLVTGDSREGFTTIVLPENWASGQQVVVKGAYTLLSMMFNVEEE